MKTLAGNATRLPSRQGNTLVNNVAESKKKNHKEKNIYV